MTDLKLLLPLILITCSTVLLRAQKTQVKSDLHELNGFLGEWSGDLLIVKEGDTLQKVPMSLTIAADKARNRIVWNTIYNANDKPVTKPYFIEPGQTPGNFLMNENNSIKIPHFLNGNVFSGFYKVMGRYFYTENRLLNDSEMLFTITVIPEKPDLISGDAAQQGGKIPSVESHEISIIQTARLTKAKK